MMLIDDLLYHSPTSLTPLERFLFTGAIDKDNNRVEANQLMASFDYSLHRSI